MTLRSRLDAQLQLARSEGRALELHKLGWLKSVSQRLAENVGAEEAVRLAALALRARALALLKSYGQYGTQVDAWLDGLVLEVALAERVLGGKPEGRDAAGAELLADRLGERDRYERREAKAAIAAVEEVCGAGKTALTLMLDAMT